MAFEGGRAHCSFMRGAQASKSEMSGHDGDGNRVLQALNNWGLVLQELSTMVPDHERAQLVGQSVQKFRRAIRLRPEFDRACYNLGTVYYSHAHTLSSSAAAQLSSQLTQVGVLLMQLVLINMLQFLCMAVSLLLPA